VKLVPETAVPVLSTHSTVALAANPDTTHDIVVSDFVLTSLLPAETSEIMEMSIGNSKRGISLVSFIDQIILKCQLSNQFLYSNKVTRLQIGYFIFSIMYYIFGRVFEL
jgi:hypothetical protein